MSGDRPTRERVTDRALLITVLLGSWWIGALWLPSYVLPSPQRVAIKLVQLASTGDLSSNLATTFLRVLAGFALSILIGLPIGLAAGRFARFGRLVAPLLPVLNTVSSAIWAIFALLWFGLSPMATIFVVLMTGLPLIIGNVREGAEAVDPTLVEMATTLRLSRFDILRKIYLPSVLPYLFSGARLAFGFGWRVSLVAEALGATSGVGYRLRQASDLNQTDQVFAWTLIQVAMMLLIEVAAIKPLERHLFRWRRSPAVYGATA